MCVNSEGSGETVRMRRLAWAFAGRLCDKYHNLMSWLNYTRRLKHQVKQSSKNRKQCCIWSQCLAPRGCVAEICFTVTHGDGGSGITDFTTSNTGTSSGDLWNTEWQRVHSRVSPSQLAVLSAASDWQWWNPPYRCIFPYKAYLKDQNDRCRSSVILKMHKQVHV